jgi:hypothetical protein
MIDRIAAISARETSRDINEVEVANFISGLDSQKLFELQRFAAGIDVATRGYNLRGEKVEKMPRDFNFQIAAAKDASDKLELTLVVDDTNPFFVKSHMKMAGALVENYFKDWHPGSEETSKKRIGFLPQGWLTSQNKRFETHDSSFVVKTVTATEHRRKQARAPMDKKPLTIIRFEKGKHLSAAELSRLTQKNTNLDPRLRVAASALTGALTVAFIAKSVYGAEPTPRPRIELGRKNPTPPVEAQAPVMMGPVLVRPEALVGPTVLTGQAPPKDIPNQPPLVSSTAIAEVRAKEEIGSIQMAVQQPKDISVYQAPEAIGLTREAPYVIPEASREAQTYGYEQSKMTEELVVVEQGSTIWDGVKMKLRSLLKEDPTNFEIADIAAIICEDYAIDSPGLGVEGSILDTEIQPGAKFNLSSRAIDKILKIQTEHLRVASQGNQYARNI